MRAPCRAGTVFVYSGQGSQWAGMGRQLLADEPAFAAAVAELEPVFVEQVGFSLRQVLAAGEPVVGIDRIQPVLVGVQLALTELWRCYGVTPDAVIGHSMGEVSAAVVAGALSPADGLAVIATRSRLMARLAGQGAMALLELDPEATEALIADYPDVTLAVYASPRQTVIAGPPAQVDAVIAVVDAQDRLARRIEVDVASHHPIIDPILPELRSALADLTPQPPTIPVLTTTQDHTTTGRNRFRRRVLGGQPAQPGAVQPGRRHRGRRARHLRGDQPAPAAHPRHQRHPGRGSSPQHRHPAARHPRHADVSTPTSTPPTPPTRRTPSTRPNPIRSFPPPPGTTATIGSPAPRPFRWQRTPCSGSVSRTRRTAPGCGKARSVRIFCGSVTTASTTRACCPGRRTPNSRWRR